MNVKMSDELLNLYTYRHSKEYRDVERNPELLNGYIRAVNTMKGATDINVLRSYSYLHYERLKYELSDYSSVRWSNRYVHRLLFTETEDGIEVKLIDIDDTHYGNK